MIEAAALRGAPGVCHGFFTREGGASEGPYASLNCGFGSGDVRERVAENRDLAMGRLGFAGADLATVYQVHSANAVVVDAPWPPSEAPKADGMASRTPGVVLGVLTADCAPVLFADRDAAVIGAAHAGWKGAFGGIVEAVVGAMVGLGARPGTIVAAIGPCIQQDSYEVGDDFYRTFTEKTPGNRNLFRPGKGTGFHQFDLPGYVRRRLEALGIGHIEDLAFDTCGDDARFFSYRRATKRGESDYGRGLSAIALVR